MKMFSNPDESNEIRTRQRNFKSFALKFLVVLIPVAFIYAANPFIPEFYGEGSVVPAGGGGGSTNHSESSGSEDSGPTFIDPNWIGASYYDQNGNIVNNVSFGRQKQGLAASVVFNSSTPAGWTEAFPFSMTVNGVNDYSLKDGTLKIHIPGSVQKAGRVFAVLAIDKNGKIHVYQDADPQPNVFSAKLDVEGYAFDLIFFD